MTRPQATAAAPDVSLSSLAPGPDTHKPLIVVVGAGVIGLTVAHELLARGNAVTVVARETAYDSHSTAFASPWAGAVWCPFTDVRQPRQSQWELETFTRWAAIKEGLSSSATTSHVSGQSNPALATEKQKRQKHTPELRLPDSVLSLAPFKRIMPSSGRSDDTAADAPRPWWGDVMPNFRMSDGRMEAETFCLNSPAYLRAMQESLESHPDFAIVHAEVTSLVDTCALLRESIACVVNATGLGAGRLTDVLDTDVEPIGGQLVRLQAQSGHLERLPSIFIDKPATTQYSDSAENGSHRSSKEKDAVRTVEVLYAIPRARSGELMLGGTEQYGTYDTKPDDAQTLRILQGMVAYCPWMRIESADGKVIVDGSCRGAAEDLLANGHDRDGSSSDSDENSHAGPSQVFRILSVGMGLRPSRKGGPRLELDANGITPALVYRANGNDNGHGNGDGATSPVALPSQIPVVHAYGFGKTGFQVSWGVAREVAGLVDAQVK